MNNSAKPAGKSTPPLCAPTSAPAPPEAATSPSPNGPPAVAPPTTSPSSVPTPRLASTTAAAISSPANSIAPADLGIPTAAPSPSPPPVAPSKAGRPPPDSPPSSNATKPPPKITHLRRVPLRLPPPPLPERRHPRHRRRHRGRPSQPPARHGHRDRQNQNLHRPHLPAPQNPALPPRSVPCRSLRPWRTSRRRLQSFVELDGGGGFGGRVRDTEGRLSGLFGGGLLLLVEALFVSLGSRGKFGLLFF